MKSAPTYIYGLVRLTGLEPARPGTLDPKSSASTNSATGAAEKDSFFKMQVQR